MLTVESLSAWYGAARILYDLSFEVGRGEVVALMGRNGAGKSTTMKAVMGLRQPSARGLVRFNGEDISDRKPFEIARRGLGFTPEDRRIFVDLTVMENLDIGRQPPRCFRRWQAGSVMDAGAAVRTFPQSRRNAGSARWAHERRRTANAHCGAHADGKSTAGATRRAVRRRGTLDRRADGAHHSRVERSRACRFCCPSRISISPAWYRIVSMCWKRARSTGRVLSHSSTATRRFKGLI